jgi:large subunit ribosomal protein L35
MPTVFTEAMNLGDLLKFEAPNLYSRDRATVASGQNLPLGTVVGIVTATGKVKHGVAGKRHRLISHNAKYIRQNRGTSVLSSHDTPTIKKWAPYGLD